MNNFSKSQLEAMRIVKSDLNFIKTAWGDNIDDDSLRRNSSVLRQLLIDEGGLLAKVKEWLGIPFYVQASTNPLQFEKLERIMFYSAGGGTFHGITQQSTIMGNYVPTPEEIKKRYEAEKDHKTDKYTLTEFLSIPSMIVNGNTFNRIEIIKFVANKLGGTHFELEEKNLARMRHLTSVKDGVTVADKNAIYFEFLSIGQLIAKSKYTERLIKKMEETV